MQYLQKIESQDGESEGLIMQNYETEYDKLETVSNMLIQMITEYKTKL